MKCKECSHLACPHRITDAEQECFYETHMQPVPEDFQAKMFIPNTPPVDIDTFRMEAAKDILAGMMTRIPPCDYGISHAEVMATYAVLYANKLIDELKIEKK